MQMKQLTSTPIVSMNSSPRCSEMSTPRRKKEVPFIQFELEGEKKAKHEKPQSISLTVEKSKTAAVLKSVLKDCNYPTEYEILKSKWKVNPKFYEIDMKTLTTKIGVKLQSFYDKWWSEMISIEKKTLQSSTSLEVVDKEVENSYNELKRNVSLCKKLKKNFLLRDPM